MKDIFDAKIICKTCNVEMLPCNFERGGFRFRAVKCSKCNDKIVHPADLERFKHYNDIKGKTYRVKLRVVGNSHAVSIPKEIVNFINEMNGVKNRMDDVVILAFEDFGKLSLSFDDEEKKKWQ